MKENINKIKKCKLFNRIKEDELVLRMAHHIEKETGLKGIYSKVGDIDV